MLCNNVELSEESVDSISTKTFEDNNMEGDDRDRETGEESEGEMDYDCNIEYKESSRDCSDGYNNRRKKGDDDSEYEEGSKCNTKSGESRQCGQRQQWG